MDAAALLFSRFSRFVFLCVVVLAWATLIDYRLWRRRQGGARVPTLQQIRKAA